LAPVINSVSILKEVTNGEIHDDDNLGKYGSVLGMIHTAGFPPYTEISGAKIVLEGDLVKRITFSGVLGFYGFNLLEIGRLYTLTVTHPRYKTETETFIISAYKLHIFINFPMEIKYELSEQTLNLNTITGLIQTNEVNLYQCGQSTSR
jgi:hypothetical protein